MRHDYEMVRAVDIEGYMLQILDTHEQLRTRSGSWLAQHRLAYRLIDPDGVVLFEGDDFGASPMHAIDSDQTLRALLGFLTLRPGDTDAEYFDDYTPAQLAFAHGDAEHLSFWSLDDGPPFVDIDLDDIEAAS